MRCKKIKAGVTVEAAFLMPLICFFLCGMIVVTITLFEKVREYGMEICDKKQASRAVQLIRLETMVEQMIKEEPEDEDGI